MEIAIGASALLSRLLIRLQGAPAIGLNLEQAAKDELPELRLNTCLVSEVFVQILANGVGTLSFIWATVVLLGGFSVFLHKADFWVITVIVFIQAAKAVDVVSSTKAKFFTQVPPAVLELGPEQSSPWGRRRPLTGAASGNQVFIKIKSTLSDTGDFVGLMALFTSAFLVVPLVAASGFIALSIFRLCIITRHWYRAEGADGSNVNVLRALIFFYALVLAEGGLLLILWFNLRLRRSELRKLVCLAYQFDDKGKKELIDKYIDSTMSACIETGVSKTINKNLVSFALDLLQSEYSHDRISAVLVLHTLTSQDGHKARALSQIQSSAGSIAKMLSMLSSSKSGTDQENKMIAQIIMKLGSQLRLSDIPGATESISSLVDPYLTKPSTIVHGLQIIAKLAGNPDNCTKICSTKGLLSKITAPISNQSYTVVLGDGVTTVEIVDKSLVVLSKLVSGTDEKNEKISQVIYDNGLVMNSIYPILSSDPSSKYSQLKVPAIKMLTKLVLVDYSIGNVIIHDFITVLTDFLLGGGNGRDLRRTAGKALALLALKSQMYSAMIMKGSTVTGHSVVHSLSAMLSDTSNMLYGTAVAQMLMQFCANSSVEQPREHLTPIRTVLHEVLKIVCNEASTNQPDIIAQPNPRPDETVVQFSSPTNNPPYESGRGSDTLQNQTQNLSEDGHQDQTNRRSINIRGGNVQAPLEPARRKTLVAFLGLAVQMCDKLVDANDLDAAVAQIPLSPAKFVGKLKEIIKLCNKDSVGLLKGKGPLVDYLAMIKSVTKLCAWVMRTRPSHVTRFREKGIGRELKKALEATRELELAVLLTCSADEIKKYETLSSVVEDARRLIQPHQP